MPSEVRTSAATCQALPDITFTLPFLAPGLAVLAGDEASYLLCAPYSSTGHSQLFHIDLTTGETTRTPLATNSAHAVAGPEGAAYIGTTAGELMQVTMPGDSPAAFGTLGAGEAVTALAATATQVTFGGAGGTVAVYTPATDHLDTYSIGTVPIHAFLPTPDGITAFSGGDSPAIHIFHPAEGTWMLQAWPDALPHQPVTAAISLADGSILVTDGTHLYHLAADLRLQETLPALPEGDNVYCLRMVQEEVLVCGGFTGALYRWVPVADDAPAGWQRLGTPMPYDPLTFTSLPDGRAVGVTYQGRLVRTTPDCRMYNVTTLPTQEPCGMAIGAMAMGPDRKLYVAPTHNMRLARWDPEEDEVDRFSVAAPYLGEVAALCTAGERLYLALTAACGVMSYHPDLGYRLLENPRVVGMPGHGLQQPVGLMVSHHGKLYLAANPASPHQGGGIVRITPVDHRLDAFPDIIPGQRLTSLAIDRLYDLVVVGSVAIHAPATVAVWSPAAEATLRTLTPFRNAALVRVWIAEGGRVYLTDGGAQLAILAPESGELLDRYTFPLGAISTLTTARDGELYGIAGGWLFHLDSRDGQVERLVEAEGTHLTAMRRGLFAYTHAGRIYKVQLW